MQNKHPTSTAQCKESDKQKAPPAPHGPPRPPTGPPRPAPGARRGRSAQDVEQQSRRRARRPRGRKRMTIVNPRLSVVLFLYHVIHPHPTPCLPLHLPSPSVLGSLQCRCSAAVLRAGGDSAAAAARAKVRDCCRRREEERENGTAPVGSKPRSLSFQPILLRSLLLCSSFPSSSACSFACMSPTLRPHKSVAGRSERPGERGGSRGVSGGGGA